MPYFDVKPNDPFFMVVQKIGATGILKGTGQPNAWANRTWFYPDSTIEAARFIQDLNSIMPVSFHATNKLLTVKDLFSILQKKYTSTQQNKQLTKENFKKSWLDAGLSVFDVNRHIKRVEAAVMIDRWLEPFEKLPIDIHGKIIQTKTR